MSPRIESAVISSRASNIAPSSKIRSVALRRRIGECALARRRELIPGLPGGQRVSACAISHPVSMYSCASWIMPSKFQLSSSLSLGWWYFFSSHSSCCCLPQPAGLPMMSVPSLKYSAGTPILANEN